jgi:hypothetical protein
MSQPSQAQEISDPIIRDIISAVGELCIAPDRQGEHSKIEATGSGGTVVRLVGIEGEVRFSQEDWEGIRDYLKD